MTSKEFVIIGGSIAGLSAIKAIREENSTAHILWVTNEDRLPYKRTQINKNITIGFEKDAFAMVDHDWLIDNHIELLFDEVILISHDKKELTFKHRGNLKYEKLILCTGNIPKKISIAELDEEYIFHIHTARQAENIIRNANKAKDYLVIGAGVEGIETAEQLIKLNKNVTIVEKENHVLKRFFTPKYSKYIEEILHVKNANLLLNNHTIEFIEEKENKVYLSLDGKIRKFDSIISTIGYIPNLKLAIDSKIQTNKGILVDKYLQTSIEGIYAAGDAAEHTEGAITGLWHAAEKQGYIAGKNACSLKTELTLEPYRMKTELFNQFFFSVLPKEDELKLITEEKALITRDLYFKNNKLHACLMRNDKERAKIYQKALLEHWDLNTIHKELPL